MSYYSAGSVLVSGNNKGLSKCWLYQPKANALCSTLTLSTNLGGARRRAGRRQSRCRCCAGRRGGVELGGLRRGERGLEYPVADPPVDLVAFAVRLVYHIVVDERVVG